MFVRVLNFPVVLIGLASFILFLVSQMLWLVPTGDTFLDLQKLSILSSFGELISFIKFLAKCMP